MKKIKFLILALVVGFALQSCTIAKFGGRGSVPIILNQPNENMEVMEHVTISKTIKFDYSKSYDVSEVLASVIAEKKPDAIANVNVKLKLTVGNYFLTLVTCGLANAHTIEVDADFMQYVDESEGAPKKKKKGRK